MNYEELKDIIMQMTPDQRKTEVCIFDDPEDGSHSWACNFKDLTVSRPILIGVRANHDKLL